MRECARVLVRSYKTIYRALRNSFAPEKVRVQIYNNEGGYGPGKGKGKGFVATAGKGDQKKPYYKLIQVKFYEPKPKQLNRHSSGAR